MVMNGHKNLQTKYSLNDVIVKGYKPDKIREPGDLKHLSEYCEACKEGICKYWSN